MSKSINDYLTVEEAASALGTHVNTIRNYIRRGDMPNTYKKGHTVLVYAADVEALKQRKGA